MITPATAITGTSALKPMSGTSAAARITPVPKPPMPPTIAAPSASTATAASVVASSGKLAARNRARLPGRVDGDVGERRLGDLHHAWALGTALGVDLDRERDRRGADPFQVDVEGQEVADLHRLLEHEFLDRHGGDPPAREPGCDGAARDVDLRHD